MKLGIHLSTYVQKWEDTGLEYIEHAAKVGYRGVELPLTLPFSYDAKEAKKLLKKYKLLCTCGNGQNPMEDISSEDSVVREKGLLRLKKCIDICEYLDSDCLSGVLYSPWGLLKPREEAKENYRHSIYNLQEAADYAKEKGVTLALELLNRYESYFINTVEEGKDFLKKIDRNNVKLHFDTFHSNIEEVCMKDALITGAEAIYHVHFCENHRGAPGTGSIDWCSVKEGLQRIGYKRWIMIENFVMPNTPAGNDVGIWKSYGLDAIETAEYAFRYISELYKDILE